MIVPELGVDIHVAALVGMASMFAGASHALLASIVFTFEITRQAIELLPLLAGCSAAYLVSLLLMRSSIMTEKLARRGTNVRTEYTADFLDRVLVRDGATRAVVSIRGNQTLHELRDWLATRAADTSHQGFPVIDESGMLLGVLTRRDLLDPINDGSKQARELIHRTPVVVYEDNTLREAADHMVRTHVGRLPVVARAEPWKVVGMISRSDLLTAHQHRLDAALITETPPIGRAWLRRQLRMQERRVSGEFPKVD
jgi:CBS domain-containing protein